MVFRTYRRNTLKIGIFVEGKSDKDTIPKLIRKIIPNAGIEIRVLRQGETLNIEKVKSHKDALIKMHSDIDKIVVCRDSECANPDDIKLQIQKIEKEVKVRYSIIVHALETWLLSDENAVAKIIGQSITPITSPESECKPKDTLKQIFSKAGKNFEHIRDDPKIAEFVDIKIIKQKCPSFCQFYDVIADP